MLLLDCRGNKSHGQAQEHREEVGFLELLCHTCVAPSVLLLDCRGNESHKQAQEHREWFGLLELLLCHACVALSVLLLGCRGNKSHNQGLLRLRTAAAAVARFTSPLKEGSAQTAAI